MLIMMNKFGEWSKQKQALALVSASPGLTLSSVGGSLL